MKGEKKFFRVAANKFEKFLAFLVRNSRRIYIGIVVAFLIAGIVYGFRGYMFYEAQPPIKDSNELLGRLFSPVMIAAFRVVVVTLMGIFVASVITGGLLKRMKVWQLEVEFFERGKEITEKQNELYNQFVFISELFQNKYYFFEKQTELQELKESLMISTSSEERCFLVFEDLLSQYKEFVEGEEETIHYHLTSVGRTRQGEVKQLLSSPEENSIAERLIKNPKDYAYRFYEDREKNRYSLIARYRSEALESEFVLKWSRKSEPFSELDAEVIHSIFGFGGMVVENWLLLNEG